MSVTSSASSESTASGARGSRPRRVRHRRDARHRRGDRPEPRRPGRDRRRRLQPRSRTAAGVRGKLQARGDGQHPPGQRRLGRRLPAHGRRGARPARPPRHPRQQRRHHDRQDGPEDDRRGLVQGPRRQPLRRVLHEPGGTAAHDRARLGPDHQHLLDHRRDRQHRAGQLRRVEVRALRTHQDARARGRLPAQARGKLDEDGIGVTVNTVAPGFIATEMLEHVPEKVLDEIKAKIPLGRLGSPRRSPASCTSSCADESSYITGQIWGVNGGMDM